MKLKINMNTKSIIFVIYMVKNMKSNYLVNNNKLIREWHWAKNQKFDPKKLTNGSSIKVWWICPNGHEYEAKICNRNNGTKCPYCSGKKVLAGFNDLEIWCKENNRIDLIEEFDKNKNEFSINEITVGSGKKVWWLCPNGHSYSTTIAHRIKMNTGCGYCSHKLFLKGYNDLATTNPEIAMEWDYEKNTLTPDMVMAGSNNKKYWFICPKGHSYKTTLLGRKKGTNCPICSKELRVSFPEKAIYYYLNQYIKNVMENYHIDGLGTKELDIFLKDYNIAIEYDGKNWHKSSKRDLEKDLLCKNNSIELIRIREIGCPKYDSNSIKYEVQEGKQEDLEEAIKFIYEFINKKYNKKLKFEVNIERDRIKIYELMELQEKNNSLLKKCPNILDYWDNEANSSIKPDQISHSSMKKIHLICSKGHKWTTNAHSFSKFSKCPICSGYKVLPGYNDLGTTNPNLIQEWSPSNRISWSNFSYGSNAKVLWICPVCQGEYYSKIRDKVKGTSCPYCTNHKVLPGYNDFATICPNKVKEWSPENKSKPNDFLPYSRKEVLWVCEKGHTYKMKIMNKTRGNGCPICANRRVIKGINDLGTCNPTLAKEFDIKRNKIEPSEVVYGGYKKYWWKCKKGHSYECSIRDKINGYACPICSSHKIQVGYNDLKTINPQLASEFNLSKNNGKTTEDYMPNSGKTVWWKCSKCGFEWEASIFKRNKGQKKCPNCNKKFS